MRRLLFALLLIAPSLAYGDTPRASIAGVSTVAPGGLLVLSGIDAVSDEPILWECKSGPAKVTSLTLDQGARRGVVLFVPQMPTVPGTYRFKQVVLGTPPGASKVTADADVFDVTVTGVAPSPVPPSPTPSPTPEPSPPPAPAPVVVGHLYATYLADATKVLPVHASMKRPGGIVDAFKSLDASWKWYQSDEAEPNDLHLIPAAAKIGYPCVLIQSQTGEVLKALSSPTVDSVVAAVKELRGQR
jgi:hypothetical protein